METYLIYVLLFISAVVGGILNAFAGGGGFIVFPSLILGGFSTLKSNAIACVALWTGNLVSARTFKNDISIQKKDLVYLLSTTLAGAICGAILMVLTDPQVFKSLVPYFHLISWLMFCFSQPLLRLMKKGRREHQHFQFSIGKLLPLFLVNLYGGYFSAGIGIMVLSLFSLFGMRNLNEMNGLKTVLVSVNNGIAAIIFIFSGFVELKVTLILITGAMIGGYYGAKISRKLNQEVVRKAIMVIGGLIAIYFFFFI